MRRQALLVVVAALLVAGGWSAGAQRAVADFEINVEVPRGQVTASCARGCDWPQGASLLPTISLLCETERCRFMFNGYGRITLGMPRTTR
jgi:hypothetical protein